MGGGAFLSLFLSSLSFFGRRPAPDPPSHTKAKPTSHIPRTTPMRSRAATLFAAACAALALAVIAAPAPAREGRAAGGEGRLGAAPAASAHPPPRYGGAKPPLDLPAEDLTHAPLDLAKRGGVSSDLPGPVTEVPADVLARGVAAAAAAVVAAGMAGGGGKTANETTAAAAKVAAALLTAAQREGAAAGALQPPANYGEGEETAAQAYPRRREDGASIGAARARAPPRSLSTPPPSTSAPSPTSIRLPLPPRPPPGPGLLPRPALRPALPRPVCSALAGSLPPRRPFPGPL